MIPQVLVIADFYFQWAGFARDPPDSISAHSTYFYCYDQRTLLIGHKRQLKYSRLTMTKSARRGISLRLLFSLAISCTTLLMGSLLAWQHYRSVETAMISAAG